MLTEQAKNTRKTVNKVEKHHFINGKPADFFMKNKNLKKQGVAFMFNIW